MESAESDLRNLFFIFYEVVRFCEGCYSDSNIYTVFKSAKLLEKTYFKIKSIGGLEDFENKLNEFWVLKGLEIVPLKFFQKVSHEVLSRFLTDSNFSDDSVKSAVKQFLALNSEQEFLEVVKKLHHNNLIVQMLKQSCTNTADYNAALHLDELSKILAIDDDSVEDPVSLLTSVVFGDTDNFKAFLKLLCSTNFSSCCSSLQEIVVVVSKVLSNPDNIHLYPFIFELSDADFCLIVTLWDPIRESLLKMIEFSITNLKCNYSNSTCFWVNKDEVKCLTFQEITILINKFKLTPNICNQILECLNRLRQNGHRIVVEDIERECKIN